jgi:hypothetical protein
MLKNAQLAYRQFIDLERAETRLLDHHAADRKAADRQRPDGDRAERRRAQRQRQQAGRWNGFGLPLMSRAIVTSVAIDPSVLSKFRAFCLKLNLATVLISLTCASSPTTATCQASVAESPVALPPVSAE